MRIVQVHARYRNPGGEDAVVAAEATLLRRAGHEVLTFSAANPRRALPSIVSAAQAPWNSGEAERFVQRLRHLRPDVVHVHNTWFSLSPAVVSAAAEQGVPVVMTLHNYRLFCVAGDLHRDGRVCTDCLGGSPLPGVVHRCYRDSWSASALLALTIQLNRSRETWDAVSRFITLTESDRRLFAEHGIEPERLVVKPHFLPDPGERTSRPSQSDTVVFAGRLTRAKGIHVLMEAWRRAALPLRLVCYGDGDDRPEADALPPGVELLGWQPREEVVRTMLGARATVSASLTPETFGLSILEGLAAGVPVLASDVGAVREILPEPSHRLLSEVGSVDALADALRALLDDDLVDRLGAAARETFLDRYQPSTALAALEDIYEQAR